MYGKINFFEIDTTPGAPSAFAPPAGFDGDYVGYMQARLKADRGVRQHVSVVGLLMHWGHRISFGGPYAEQARELAKSTFKTLDILTQGPKIGTGRRCDFDVVPCGRVKPR